MEQSVWMDEVCLDRFPKLEGDLRTDVLIVGGGMAGVLCAWMLRERGIDCALVEAGRICRGVTGRTTAKITSQHGLAYHKLIRRFGAEKARMYYDANQAALERYRVLARRFPCDLETKKNGVYSVDDPGKLEQEWKALGQLGIPALYSEQLPVPLDTCGGIFFPEQAQFHPLKLISGIAKRLQIYENTPARAFAPGVVKTDRGTVRAEKIILATHFPVINKHGAYFLKLYQERSYVIALENAMDVRGMYLDEKESGFSFRNAGDLLLLGGGSHRTGKPTQGWKPLEDFALRQFPEAKIRYRWATQDCMSLDGVPYIGRYSPSTPDLYVATGFNKWGMSQSMVAAMMLSDLVQGKNHPWEPLFAPARSILRPQLIVNGWESAVHLLTPVKPRCPHMGCALKWNPREHSWDCPCHGSRFDDRGRLLENPAMGNMEKR